MNEKMKKEWKKLMCEDREYSIGEAVEKYKDVILYLKSKNMRTSPTDYGIDNVVVDGEFRLSEEDKKRYFLKYKREGYTDDSCVKIIKSIDTIYHYYNVSVDEAERIASYAIKHKITLTQAIEECTESIGLTNYIEFLETVFPSVKNMYDSVVLRYGIEFITCLSAALQNL